jgi:hypothetical protein
VLYRYHTYIEHRHISNTAIHLILKVFVLGSLKFSLLLLYLMTPISTIHSCDIIITHIHTYITYGTKPSMYDHDPTNQIAHPPFDITRLPPSVIYIPLLNISLHSSNKSKTKSYLSYHNTTILVSSISYCQSHTWERLVT